MPCLRFQRLSGSLLHYGRRWAMPLLLGVVLAGAARAAFELERMRQTALQRYGAAAAEAVDGWRAAMAGWRELPEVEQLQRVNEFFNRRIRFAEDPVVWGQPDYWATPLETLARGAATARTLSLRSTSACASWAFQTAGCA
jgi:predicted transglutaminase-like cysteine proteinase